MPSGGSTFGRVPRALCLSAVEAVAYGRAATVTNRGALPEVVDHGKSGSVVVGGDSGALAAAIRQYALTPDLIVAQASAGRGAAEPRRPNLASSDVPTAILHSRPHYHAGARGEPRALSIVPASAARAWG